MGQHLDFDGDNETSRPSGSGVGGGLGGTAAGSLATTHSQHVQYAPPQSGGGLAAAHPAQARPTPAQPAHRCVAAGSLDAFLHDIWAAHDVVACVVVLLLAGTMLSRAQFTRLELIGASAKVAVQLIAIAAATLLAPKHYAVVRPWLTVALRLAIPAMAMCMDPVAVFADGAQDGRATGVGRALVTLLLPVCWMQGPWLGAAGRQLRPLEHLAAHSVMVALLLWRAPTACAAYVSSSSTNAGLVAALYAALQFSVSVACLGSGQPLAALAAAAGAAQQCTAVVWALLASLGFALPTLLVWQAQLRAARQYVQLQPEERRAAAQAEVQRSQYARVCVPALRQARRWGWGMTSAAAALLGFVAALLLHGPAPGQPAAA